MATESPPISPSYRAAFKPLAYSLALHLMAFALFELTGLYTVSSPRELMEVGSGGSRVVAFDGGGGVSGGASGSLAESGEGLRRVLAGDGLPTDAPAATSEESRESGPERETSSEPKEPEPRTPVVSTASSAKADESTGSEETGRSRVAKAGADSSEARGERDGAGEGGKRAGDAKKGASGGEGGGAGSGEGKGRGSGKGVGGPTLAAINAVIRDNYDEIDRCYAAYRRYAGVGKRRVQLKFQLGTRPRPESVYLVEFSTDEKVARCIARALGTWEFPTLSKTVEFDKTFVFHRESSQQVRPSLGDFYGGPPKVD